MHRAAPLLLTTLIAGCSSKGSQSKGEPAPASSPNTKAAAPVQQAEAKTHTAEALVESSEGSPILVLYSEAVAGIIAGKTWTPAHEVPSAQLETLVKSFQQYTPVDPSIGPGPLPKAIVWNCNEYLVKLKNKDAGAAIIGATWPMHPRRLLVPSAAALQTHKAKARAQVVLKNMGAKTELQMDTDNLGAVDLDGDGQDEIVWPMIHPTLAERLMVEGLDPEKGDYSGLLVLPGSGSSGLWVGEVMDQEDPWFGGTTIAGAADINGDGRLELFVEDRGFSGGLQLKIYSYRDSDLTLIATAGWGESDCYPAP